MARIDRDERASSRRARFGAAALALVALVATGACSKAEASAQAAQATGPATGVCGTKGLPDCPLQGWMKSTLQAYLKDGDSARLASALDDLAAHAPQKYPEWAASANRAAKAARAGDVAGVKAECKACHDRDRSSYRAEMRAAHLL